MKHESAPLPARRHWPGAMLDGSSGEERPRHAVAFSLLGGALLCALCAVDSASAGQNQVLVLDGGDYVELPGDAFAALSAATVEAWVRWDELGFYTQPFGGGDADAWRVFALNNRAYSSTLQYFIYQGKEHLHLVSVPHFLQAGRWYHLAAVSGPGGMRLYVNGVQVGEHPFAGSFAGLGAASKIYLGRSHWPENAGFKGRIDEVRVWNFARGAAQIRADMHRRLRGREEGLVGLWNFDDGDARDQTRHGHHGLLRGGAHCRPEELPAPSRLRRPAVLYGLLANERGQPLPGARLRLRRGGEVLGEWQADGQGQYSLVGEAVETPVDLVAVAGPLSAQAWNLPLRAGQRQRLDLTLRRGGLIEGRLLALDRLTPHSAVVVEARRQGRVWARALSDARGYYSFTDLAPGAYVIRCLGLQGALAERRLQLHSGEKRKGVDFYFPPFKKGEWRNFTYLDGLPSNQVSAIVQAADGALWFGTQAGAARFDGRTFRSFGTRDGLAGDVVAHIVRARDHSLWFATDGGASRFDGHRFTSYGPADGLADDRVHAIYQDSSGALLFATEEGVSRFDGETFADMAVRPGHVTRTIHAICGRADRSLWFGFLGGAVRRDGAGYQLFTIAQGLPDGDVLSLYCGDPQRLWLGTARGIAWAAAGKITPFPGAAGLDDQRADLFDMRIESIMQDRSGTTWFGTQAGAARFDGEHLVVFTRADGLVDDWVHAIYQDSSGALWLGTDGGVSRYVPWAMQSFDVRDGPPGSRIYALYRDEAQALWLGTEAGAARFDGERFTAYGRAEGLAGEAVYAIYQDDAGALWFGTEAGVSHFDPGRSAVASFTSHRSRGNAGSARITGIVQDASGTFFFATYDGLLRYRDGFFERLEESDGLADNQVLCAFRDRDGALWFGTEGGVSRFDGKGFTSYSRRDGLADDQVRAIYQDADGILYFGTWSGGVSLYDGETWSVLDVRDGLAGNQVLAIAAAGDTLLFGTNRGLTRYRRGRNAPRARIEAVQTDSLYTDLSRLPEVVAGHRISVHYGAIDFETHPAKRQYRYRIEELDAGWRPPTRATSFEWTPEQPGTYTFALQAIDRDLNYSAPVRLELVVVAPWHENAWIVAPLSAGVALLMVVAMVSSSRYLAQRHETRRLREEMLHQERRARADLEVKNAQLERAWQEAEQASRAKSLFLANMSHEIRTPMNAILGYAQLLQDSGDLKEEHRRALEAIDHSGTHLLALIDDVLDLAKIEAGREELQVVDFDLNGLILGLAAMFEMRCAQKNLAWRVEAPAGRCAVRGDEHKLRQVLINLLDNAVKFTAVGEVALIVGKRGKERYYFAVCDTGPGIAAEQQERIFDAFEQGDVGARQGGTGLGLAIARRHVRLMGGELELASQPGRGTRFSFSLPLPAASAAAAAPPPRRLKRPVRALVVDDVGDNREVLAQMLGRLGAEVRLASSGAEALALAAEQRPDIAFLDIRMPGMDGIEVMHRLRALGGALSVVAISASVLAHERQRYLGEGFDAFVPKPFRRQQLCDCLAQVLGAEFEWAPAPSQGAAVPPRQAPPPELARRLREAARFYSVTELEELIDQIEAAGAAELAASLRQYSRRYDMEGLLRLLDEVERD